MWFYKTKEKITALEHRISTLEKTIQIRECKEGNHAPYEIYINSRNIPIPRCPNCYYHPLKEQG